MNTSVLGAADTCAVCTVRFIDFIDPAFHSPNKRIILEQMNLFRMNPQKQAEPPQGYRSTPAPQQVDRCYRYEWIGQILFGL